MLEGTEERMDGMEWEWDGASVHAHPQQQLGCLESSAWQHGNVVAEWLGR